MEANQRQPAATSALPPFDTVVEDLTRGRPGAVVRLFADRGVRSPMVVWSPTDSDLQNPLLQEFADICRGMQGDDGHIRVADFNLAAFAGLKDWIMVVDVEEPGVSYKYRYYGPGIAETYGANMQGARVSDFSSHISLFFGAVYHACERQREWIFTEHAPPERVFVSAWRRLVVPLVDESDQVVRFVVLNLPENPLRAGLAIIPDPVFVLDERLIIRFANKAALDLFGPIPMASEGQSFEAATGVALAPPQAAKDMIAARAVHQQVSLGLRDTLLAEFDMTLSAALLKGQAYYIVMMRIVL